VPCLGTDRLRGLRGVESLLPLVPALTDALPDMAAAPRAAPDAERYALFDAVVALLGVASASAPIVLVLDDLHWAAKPTLLLLRHLLRFGEQARVQIVGTYRSTDLDRAHPLAAMLADLHRDGSATRLPLGGLDEDDVTAYVAEAGYADEELARALASVTGGNPFFLIEALRHVDESDGRWDPNSLPQGVREAVSRRLSRLPVESNTALAAAAVVGSRFTVDFVERVVERDLVDAFDEAAKAGIVIEEPGGRYRFNHALVRQSLLAELPSVRRMRLHQKIAAALESESGSADDERLAELAYHYFECAWAGNADKAVEYCRRAADQAMARLSYEGAADLYDKALHALEELDDELPDREDLQAELLIARCEALLAAGDVVSATGAVAQLCAAAGNSPRLAAWGTCFDGQLSMLTDPDRLDEMESAVGTAADTLAGLQDAAGEAKAHTVRAGCLARLGRVGDCEIALDEALTAARRAREHRRVNAVLAGAPLAALWGPNPVPRAGGRCLDVVRLLRITTGSPVVEATSTRCQGVLDALRGRAAAGRQLIDSARRTLNELGMRHAALEVEQFAGIVELVADDATAAEQHLRKAYNGFRRMGLDADTAETAALLARACLTLERDTEADEFCTESERLAGHAFKAAIAWRSVRAQLLARGGDHDGARRVAEEAVAIAERTDALVDHGDACLALASVLGIAGDTVGAQAAAERAIGLYELKGAAALADKARRLLGELPVSTRPEQTDAATAKPENECPQAGFEAEGPRPPLANTASRVEDRCYALFAEGRVEDIGALLAEDHRNEDRRQGLQSERIGRTATLDNIRTIASLGAGATNTPLALRGDLLCLSHIVFEGCDGDLDGFRVETLELAELDPSGVMRARVVFDLDDIDAAFAELDARYLAGEAAEHADTWSVVAGAFAAFNRRELPATTPDWINIDHRALMTIDGSGLPSYAEDIWDLAPDVRVHIESVHRLTDVGAVVTYAACGTSKQGFDAEWREVTLSGVTGDLVDRCEIFHLDDLAAALAKFDELSCPATCLANAACRTYERWLETYETRDWAAMAEVIADGIVHDDRRRVVNGGIQRGRDAVIGNMRAIAEVGVNNIEPFVVATRGERLALIRQRVSGNKQPDAFGSDVLVVVESDADNRFALGVAYDPDDLDAAFAELDARFGAGEGALHAGAWSVVTGNIAAFNRHELPSFTPDVVNLDHRRVTAFGLGEQSAYVRAAWDQTPDMTMYMEAVHRLDDLGAVFTYVAKGTASKAFQAEWRGISLSILDGELISRSERFDEADLDAAIARFDELTVRVTPLTNQATRIFQHYNARFLARDWDGMAEMLADDVYCDDRRRVVSSGIQRGRLAQTASMRAAADFGVRNAESSVVATRGDRLALMRTRVSGDQRQDAFGLEMLTVFEIDGEDRGLAGVLFDLEDMDAAFADLDARFGTGEAAAYAPAWSLVAGAYALTNRHEISSDVPDVVDHRRLSVVEGGDLIASLRTAWDLTPDGRAYIEAVHRLDVSGAVVTHVAHGTGQGGFDAGWRSINVLIVGTQNVDRCELFDETDLDTALKRYEQLSAPTRLDNAASRAAKRLRAAFAARDWDCVAELLADDLYNEDRRRVVNAGIRRGRDTMLADMRATADAGVRCFESIDIATRGERLVLIRTEGRVGATPAAFHVGNLVIAELDADGRTAGQVMFDPEDTDAAFAELDARYMAGEAAPYQNTWAVLVQNNRAINRHELPAWTPDAVNIDHRRVTPFAPGDLPAFLRATWETTPDLKFSIEAVHRLTDRGAVLTHASVGSSSTGFQSEWRGISVAMIDGDQVCHSEHFDETDLDAALARFDELSRSTRKLENAATRVFGEFQRRFAAREWDVIVELLSDDTCNDDRRPVVGSGAVSGRGAAIEDLQGVASQFENISMTSDVIATRGERLALCHCHFTGFNQQSDALHWEFLGVVEIDADERITASVTLEPDDINGAIAELTTRWIASGEVAHPEAIEAVRPFAEAANRHDWDVLAAGHVGATYVNHRQLASGAGTAVEDMASLRMLESLIPDMRFEVAEILACSATGILTSVVVKGTSTDGVLVELPWITIMIFDGERVIRAETFDAGQLDLASARFEELTGGRR
jgi:hypothetical protein